MRFIVAGRDGELSGGLARGAPGADDAREGTMRPRIRQPLFVVVAVATAACGALLFGGPAAGQGTSASIVASDYAFNTAAGGSPHVTVGAGATVAFSYPSGFSSHNVVFTGQQPSGCTQTTPASTITAPPLPASPTAAGWAGQCTFTAPGTYAYVCGLHGSMTGSVTVLAPGGTPPPAPPPPPPPPPPGSTTTVASSLKLTKTQRGVKVRGSVNVARAGSRLLARAFARRGALSGGRSAVQVQVGRQLRSSVGPGRVSFSVALTATARRALRRNGRLSIALRLTVTPAAGGKSYTAKRLVTLRPA
jgi:plastocyanin